MQPSSDTADSPVHGVCLNRPVGLTKAEDKAAELLQVLLEMHPKYEHLADIPLDDWPNHVMHEFIAHMPESIGWFETLVPSRVTPQMADLAFERDGRIGIIPARLQTVEQWTQAVGQRLSALADPGVPDHLRTESFWMTLLNAHVFEIFYKCIPMEDQTPALVDRFLEIAYVEATRIRPDLLTDRVAGLIMKESFKMNDILENDAIRGMHWLLDNGFPSIFEQKHIPEVRRTPETLMQLAEKIWKANVRERVQCLVELARAPAEEVAQVVNSPLRVEIFRKAYGVDAAIHHLGERASTFRRQWLAEDMGL